MVGKGDTNIFFKNCLLLCIQIQFKVSNLAHMFFTHVLVRITGALVSCVIFFSLRVNCVSGASQLTAKVQCKRNQL